jgi:signal transduction histidine kinase
VEDNVRDFELAREILVSEGIPCECTRVDTLEQLRLALESDRIDFIISDHNLLGFTSLEVLEVVASFDEVYPVVLLTGALGEEVAVEIMRSGATDYVTKDKMYKLGLVIKRALGEVEERKHIASLLEIEQENRLLGESLASLERVLGVVAHELRTPLAAARAGIELLSMQESSTFDQQVMSSVRKEIIYLAEIVNDILDATRINHVGATWNWGDVDVAKVCEDAMKSMRSLLDVTKLELSLTGAPSGLKMRGDSSAIRRLILNLLTNSAKHTEEGLIKISYTEELSEGERYVVLSVEDNGQGISEDKKNLLGRAFALGVGSLETSHLGGVGLGLSICCAIAQVHGGRLHCDSTSGSGCKFTVRLLADLESPSSLRRNSNIVLE